MGFPPTVHKDQTVRKSCKAPGTEPRGFNQQVGKEGTPGMPEAQRSTGAEDKSLNTRGACRMPEHQLWNPGGCRATGIPSFLGGLEDMGVTDVCSLRPAPARSLAPSPAPGLDDHWHHRAWDASSNHSGTWGLPTSVENKVLCLLMIKMSPALCPSAAGPQAFRVRGPGLFPHLPCPEGGGVGEGGV